MQAQGLTDRIQDYLRIKYLDPARQRGEGLVRITAGEIHRELHLSNRVPAVCMALKSKKFLDKNGLVLEGWEGPPSGLSTTVVFTYRVLGSDAVTPVEPAFLKLRGIAKEVFQSLGGGEKFLQSERDRLLESERDRFREANSSK